jgi:hypothetical protein
MSGQRLLMNEVLLIESDKQYWHRYIPVYVEELSRMKKCVRILEFGVFKGDSIKWLQSIYPLAQIYGCDILPVQPQWPLSGQIKYFQIDQGVPTSISSMFVMIGEDLDLIIEDGSHLPEHQKNCLVEGLRHLTPQGMYILEDIHTSHPGHPYYKKAGTNYIGPLHLLLFIEHFKALGKYPDKRTLESISLNSLFKPEQVEYIFDKISQIRIYKRAILPIKCYACGSTEFDYNTLTCKCGIGLYSPVDSMTAIIHVR